MKRPVLFNLIIALWFFCSGLCWGQDKEAAVPRESAIKAPSNLYWVFLKTGKSLDGIDRKDVEAMQLEHLNNFRRLAEEGRLVTAGPVSDPDNIRRGVVILKADRPEELAAMFRDDPYIKQGYMKMDSCRMKFELGKIHTRITPKGMEELRIVVLQRNPDSKTVMDSETETLTTAFLKNQYDLKQLNLSVRLFDAKDDSRHVLVFPKRETDDAILEVVNEIPAVKSGYWKQNTMPLFMGKGSIER